MVQAINVESETHTLQILYNVMIISFLHCTGKQRPPMMENKEILYVTQNQIPGNSTMHAFFNSLLNSSCRMDPAVQTAEINLAMLNVSLTCG